MNYFEDFLQIFMLMWVSFFSEKNIRNEKQKIKQNKTKHTRPQKKLKQ